MTTPDPQRGTLPEQPDGAHPAGAGAISEQAFIDMQNSPEFDELRQRFRRFSFPLSIAFLVWYMGYVLLSTYAVDFMKIKVFGNVNLGIVLGLMQFVTTFLITWLYIRHANKNLDPIASKLRAELEGGR
ncbi:DUF485 domain-containing protein [Aestuariimicrobium sp. p3-SID1156]|uniref:DUF485 domain-containing protein n=1 Tax=Aestuariimicrobium sp. p3-SID1156 TaxID=2916038 RepID=UPI00223AE4AA|nr:DUF485 domain-containing protein [Aestuariimicrobium sp. p3-SID1156]MCT1460049.1 DUF485 domain-containing protein [Aestuariimicrobium sp. p3-SID1156]